MNNSCGDLVQRTRGFLRGPRHTGSRIYLYDKFDSIGNLYSDESDEEQIEQPLPKAKYITIPVSCDWNRDLDLI